MEEVIAAPREAVRSNFSMIEFETPMEMRGLIIGRGGSNVSTLESETDTRIDLASDGKCTITGRSEEGVERAKAKILAMIEEEGGKSADKKQFLMHVGDQNRGRLIGRGGSNVSKLEELTSCSIDIIEGGNVRVTGETDEAVQSCVAAIRQNLGLDGEGEHTQGAEGRAEAHPRDFVEEVIRIGFEDRGSVLGRAGRTINMMRARSGAQLDMDQEILRIAGKAEDVQKAKVLLDEILSKRTTKVIHVPVRMKKKLIGRKGMRVAALEEATLCSISSNQDSGEIKIRGVSEEAVNEAIRRIQEVVEPLVEGRVYKAKVCNVASDYVVIDLCDQEGNMTGDQTTVDKTELGEGVGSAGEVVSLGQEIEVLCTQVMQDGAVGVFSLRALQERKGGE